MAFSVGELVAFLKLDDAQFNQAIGAAPAKAKKAGDATEQAMGGAKKATDKAATSATSLGTAVERSGQKASGAGKLFASMAGLFAGAKLVSYVTDSIKASSDLNETMSKSQQIFGAGAKDIAAWGQNAAKSMGLSRAAAIDAATSFGNMFSQLGFSSKAARDMSKSTVQMAVDLGSFNNLPTADVIDRISGAFRGEYDSLQKVIPNISAARVQQEAMTETGKTSAAALTAQEKATAVLTIVQQDGAKAMGDFARTSSGFANQSKITQAAIEDQKAALGDKLMPVVQTLMQVFTDVGIPALGAFGDILGVVGAAAAPLIKILGDLIKWAGDLPAPFQVAVVAFTAFTLLKGPVSALAGSFDGLKAKGVGALNAIKGATLGNPLGIALTVLATAISIFSSSADDAGAAADAWNSKMEDLKGTLDQVTGAVTEATKVKLADQVGTEMINHWSKLGINIGVARDAMLGVKGASDLNAASIQALTAEALGADTAFQGFAGQLKEAGVSAGDVAGALLNGNFDAVNGKLAALGLQVQQNSAGFLELTDATGASLGVLADTEGATGDLTAAYHLINGEAGLLAGAQGEVATKTGFVKSAAAGALGPTKDLTGAFADGKIDAGELAGQIQAVMTKMDELAGRNGDAEAAQRALNQQVRDYSQAILGQATSDRDLERARQDVTTATDELTAAQNKHITSSYTQADKTKDVESKTRSLEDAQTALASKTIDSTKAADAAAQQAADLTKNYIAAGQAAYNAAVLQGDQAGASDAAAKAMDGVKQSFINMQSPADIASGKAQAVADALFGIPSERAATITAVDHATAEIEAIKSAMAGLNDRTIQLRVQAVQTGVIQQYFDTSTGTYKPLYRKGGGSIYGAGGPTDDQVPVMASNGEHMWSAAETAAAGGHAGVERLRRAALAGSLPRLASGGAVRGMLSSPMPGLSASSWSQVGMSSTQAGALDVKLDRLAVVIGQLAQSAAGPRVVQLGENVSVVHPAQDTETLDSKLFRLQSAIRI